VRITVETVVKADLNSVWRAWNNPEDIKQWNAASDDWHTTESAVDLREGGTFSSRMEAKDGTEGFDFAGTYTRVVPQQLIEYRMGDGRSVAVGFTETAEGVLVKGDLRGRVRERAAGPAPRMAGHPGQVRTTRCSEGVHSVTTSTPEQMRRRATRCSGHR
jgi:uncharacterized protein YndB with AHSA1/START domain